tara:strand:- start:2979 stop:5081 length:2103 start_codon:yes stop_codon:yes gene_type:complete
MQQKKPITPIQHPHERNDVVLVNDIYSNDHTLTFHSPDPDEGDYIVRYLTHPEITSKWAWWAKEAIVNHNDGWDDVKKQTLVRKQGTARGNCFAFARIALFASRFYPDISISEWSFSHINELLRSHLNLELQFKSRIDYNKRKASYASFSSIEKTLTALIWTYEATILAEISDGLTMKLPTVKKVCKRALRGSVQKHGLIYEEWEKGKSYKALDAVLAATMTAYAISIINSPKTDFLCDFYQVQRETEGRLPFTQSNMFSLKKFAFAVDKNFDVSSIKRSNGSNRRTSTIKKDQLILDMINRHRDSITIYNSTGLPFESMSEMHKWVDKVYSACYWLFITMTGVRHSEIVSLTGDSYDETNHRYRTKVKKTDNSANHLRGGADILKQMFDILNYLTLTPKRNRPDGESISLWAKTYTPPTSKHNVNNLSKEAVRLGKELPQLTKYQDKLGGSTYSIRRHLKEFCSDFAEVQPSLAMEVLGIHPHRLRHTFAQFILRRFEGYMHESLRIHLRHAAGSYMTNVYESDKLHEDAVIATERGYINEIVQRIFKEYKGKLALEGNEDFYGTVARRIHQMISKTSTETPDQIQNALIDISDKIESIKAHNYGYCLVMKDTRALSSCYDKATNTPKTENGQFDICAGCVHFMYSKKSHETEIVNHRYLHTQQIKTYNILGVAEDSPVMLASVKAVKAAESILSQMEA